MPSEHIHRPDPHRPSDAVLVVNPFNLMVDATKKACSTQINTLSTWDEKLDNWSDVNKELSEAQLSDPVGVQGDDGKWYLDSSEYDMWVAEGMPPEGELHDTVNTQCLMVTGYTIEYYPTYKNTPPANLTQTYTTTTYDPTTQKQVPVTLTCHAGLTQTEFPQLLGLKSDDHSSACDEFMTQNFDDATFYYWDSVSQEFLITIEGVIGKFEGGSEPDDSYSGNISMLNSIASSQSSKANAEEQTSSNAVNTEGSIIQQTTSAIDVVTGSNEQLQNVLSSLISSAMGKF